MTFTIKGLDHVVLRVADLERAVRFYCEVLGCTEERRVGSINLVQLRMGSFFTRTMNAALPISHRSVKRIVVSLNRSSSCRFGRG